MGHPAVAHSLPRSSGRADATARERQAYGRMSHGCLRHADGQRRLLGDCRDRSRCVRARAYVR
eukprot:scaffold214_cov121-Isochrysis_galbana.AAC.4